MCFHGAEVLNAESFVVQLGCLSKARLVYLRSGNGLWVGFPRKRGAQLCRYHMSGSQVVEYEDSILWLLQVPQS